MEIRIANHWNDILLTKFSQKSDIYFSEKYVTLYESVEEKAKCCIVRDEEKYMILPFLKREFVHNGTTYYDFETAYGYGGPLFNTDDESFCKSSLRALHEYFAAQNFVAGFVRFHPLLNNQDMCKDVFRVIPDRKTVAIDLSGSEEEIWMDEIHTKNRNVIKKGEKVGLMFTADYEYKYLDDFIRLYNSTMDKLAADDFYYFGNDYYRQLVGNIPNSFLGVVKQGDTVLSAAIFMHSGPFGHYYLSGSDKSFLRLSPNNFMLWEAAKELKKLGCKRFHLGGGTTSSPDDSLFCFKSRFSKSTCDFAIGKLIFNEEVYRALCDDWEKQNPEKVERFRHFLLKYKY